MSRYKLTHLPDSTLLVELKSLVAQDRATTALLIAHLGEVDARRLYAPAGYPSMYEYCIHELRFSDQSAFKRIRVARVARQFPVVYGMLADGRLNLSAVVMLTGYLTSENGEELLLAAAKRTRADLERLIAERFPQPDLPTLIAPLAATGYDLQLSPGTVKLRPTEHAAGAPESIAPPTSPAKVAPLASQRFAVQFTMGQEAHDDLLYAQALLGHAVPNGDVAQIFARALKALITKLEQQKFAKTERPRACRRSDDARHIPAEVKRAVWERDGGQCTFVGEGGHRCESRTRLEFDHVEAVANGGHATVPGLRLRCRAHNQLEAERTFGRDFMETKRQSRGKPPLPEPAAEVIPWLKTLGFRAERARALAETCADMAGAPLEARVRHALKCSARSSPTRVA
jgi:5-methylcytosine-specific restriction endonuclease McrA